MATAGRATATGTARFASRHLDRGAAAGHYRQAMGLSFSSIGFGTYLGEPTAAVDEAYRAALVEAVCGGCNVLDTALSYRGQRSELALGRALADLLASGRTARDELIVASKAGFIAYGPEPPADPVDYVYHTFVEAGVAEPVDFAGGIHCMAPGYLSQQIAWSLRNTGLHTLDIFFIQNPEAQLQFLDRATFCNRLQLAFARLEEEAAAGRIGCYGVATWEGLRRPPLAKSYISLEFMVRLAAEVGGAGHHFRVVQLPVNIAMAEAATLRNQPVGKRVLTALAAAEDLGLLVLASAALAQGQFQPRMLGVLAKAFPKLDTPVQRALQLARSLPGVTTALVGTTSPAHARENCGLVRVAPQPKRALRAAQLLAR